MMSSNQFINTILSDVKKQSKFYQLQNKFDFTNNALEIWKKRTLYTIKLLEENNAPYTFIKTHDVPFAIMEDVDVLLEDHSKLKEIYQILKKLQFNFYHVQFNDKLKLSAINTESNLEIDFYPDSKWGVLRYARKNEITKTRRFGTKHGIKTYFPSPEHDIYIIASHSYYHGRITLLEVISTAKLILEQSPPLEKIISLAHRFHLHNGTFILLYITNWLLSKYGKPLIHEQHLNKLRLLSSNNFKKITSQKISLSDFPLMFSKSDLFSSALGKIVARNLDESTNRFDELNRLLKHNRITNTIYSKIFPKNYALDNFQN